MNTNQKNTRYIRPPLKWAGGKFRLLGAILPKLPNGKRLVEPFAGSGVVFLNADFPAFLLCDLNEDLIEFFRRLAQGKTHFIDACASLFRPETNTQDRFYELRERFNSLPPSEERAALFLYLNRHAYNGLIRYNAKGKFNTPFGKYVAPYFPRKEMTAVAGKVERADVRFEAADYRQTFAALEKDDVVYCDPPYVPLSRTADFTSYTAAAFGPEEQRGLAACAASAARDGNTVLISNHETPFCREIYKGAEIFSFPVQRFISSNGKNRDKAQELLAIYRGKKKGGAAGRKKA